MSDLRADIIAANQKFVTAFSSGDAAGIAACYTKDAKALPPNAPPLEGRQAIQGLWQTVLGMGLKGVKLETVAVEAAGDAAIEEGRYTLTTPDGRPADQGKYIVIWKKEDGAWKLHRDIWNSSQAAADAAAPAAD